MERVSVMGVDEKDMGAFSGGDLVGIHYQRIHVAHVASDSPQAVIDVVRLIFCGVCTKVDFGWI